MNLTVINKSNESIFTLKGFTLSTENTGERKITSTVYSSDFINFEIDSYVMLWGVKLSIYNKTKVTKKARGGEGIGDAFKYDLEFFAPYKSLERVNFDDYVTDDDTAVYYTGTSEFTFYNTVEELAYRIQANLDRFFGNGIWNVSVDSSVVLEEQQVVVSELNLYDGLALINEVYGLDYYFSGTSIIIGRSGITIPTGVQYGKGNGLYEISRSYDDSNPVVTKLKVYGSDRNIPEDYLRDEDSRGRYYEQLMLPDFANTGIDYVLASQDLIDEYGIREGVETFDDVYPSIEEIDLGEGRIDEILSVEEVDLDSKYFTVTLRDLGFDMNDYWTSEAAVISIKGLNADGTATYLGGYEFEIDQNNVVWNGTGYTVRLLRNTSQNATLPDNVTTVRSGDRFVLLGIEMPQSYITNAENKLQTTAEEWFEDVENIGISYTVKLDEKFIEENDLTQYLVAGNILPIFDEDLSLDRSIVIQTSSIKFGSAPLPECTIKLADVAPETISLKIGSINSAQTKSNVLTKISSKAIKSSSDTKNDTVYNQLVWKAT